MAEFAKSRSFNYQQIRKRWHIWLLNTPLGEPAVTFDTENFCRALWEQWSPTWNSEQMLAAFDEAKTSFQSPDFGKVVLSSYRSGMSGVGGDKRHDKLRSVIQQLPSITCDTVVLTGAEDVADGDPLPEEVIKRCFTGNFHHKIVKGAGHFIQRQRPHEVVCAILNEEHSLQV